MRFTLELGKHFLQTSFLCLISDLQPVMGVCAAQKAVPPVVYGNQCSNVCDHFSLWEMGWFCFGARKHPINVWQADSI